MPVSGTNTLWQDGTIDVGTLKIGAVAVTATPAELNIMDGVTATTAELNILDGVTATAAELNRSADVSARMIAGGSTLTLTEVLHDGKR